MSSHHGIPDGGTQLIGPPTTSTEPGVKPNGAVAPLTIIPESIQSPRTNNGGRETFTDVPVLAIELFQVSSPAVPGILKRPHTPQSPDIGVSVTESAARGAGQFQIVIHPPS